MWQCQTESYLFAQVFEQNLFDPLNWLAGARFPQYSHFNTELNKRKTRYYRQELHIFMQPYLFFHYSRAGPFSERPARAKSLSLRRPATCLTEKKHKLKGTAHVIYLTLSQVNQDTHREGLSPLLDHKTLDQVSKDLRFDHSLRNRRSVFVAEANSRQGRRQGQGRRRWEGSCY